MEGTGLPQPSQLSLELLDTPLTILAPRVEVLLRAYS
jgi:hypothetical protein